MWEQLINFNPNVAYTGGLCLVGVRNGYNLPALYASATLSWNAEPNKHYDRPPLGIAVPVYFSLSDNPDGHVAVQLSNGTVASASQAGKHPSLYIHKSIDDLMRFYSSAHKITYLGWGEHISNVAVIKYVEEQKVEIVPMDNSRVMMASKDLSAFNFDTKTYGSKPTITKGDYRLFVDKSIIDGKTYLRTAQASRTGSHAGFLFTDLLEIPNPSDIVKHLRDLN